MCAVLQVDDLLYADVCFNSVSLPLLQLAISIRSVAMLHKLACRQDPWHKKENRSWLLDPP
jgi:hypothetical protein